MDSCREVGLLDRNYFVLDLFECFLDKSKCHFTLLPGNFKAVNSKYKSFLLQSQILLWKRRQFSSEEEPLLVSCYTVQFPLKRHSEGT